MNMVGGVGVEDGGFLTIKYIRKVSYIAKLSSDFNFNFSLKLT